MPNPSPCPTWGSFFRLAWAMWQVRLLAYVWALLLAQIAYNAATWDGRTCIIITEVQPHSYALNAGDRLAPAPCEVFARSYVWIREEPSAAQ